MASKRLTKQELKEDRVITVANEAVAYAQQNARWVVAAVAVMAVAILAAVLFAQGRTRSERQAGAGMFQAQNLYFSGNFAQAATQFQGVADRYGSSRAAREARLFEGNSQLNAGNAPAAEAAFRKFLTSSLKDPVLLAAGHRGLGGSLAGQQKYPEAAAEYVLAAGVPGNAMAADDWIAAGRAYAQAGQKGEAAKAFQTVIDKFPQGQATAEARVRLHEVLGR